MSKPIRSVSASLILLAVAQMSTAAGPKGVMRFEAVILGHTDDVTSAYIDFMEIDVKRKSMQYGSRITADLVVCEEKGWYCLLGGGMDFAVPDDCCLDRKSWSFRGFDYAVVAGNESKDADVVSISAVNAKDPSAPGAVYRYSRSKGLVGFLTYVVADGRRFPAFYVRK